MDEPTKIEISLEYFQELITAIQRLTEQMVKLEEKIEKLEKVKTRRFWIF